MKRTRYELVHASACFHRDLKHTPASLESMEDVCTSSNNSYVSALQSSHSELLPNCFSFNFVFNQKIKFLYNYEITCQFFVPLKRSMKSGEILFQNKINKAIERRRGDYTSCNRQPCRKYYIICYAKVTHKGIFFLQRICLRRHLRALWENEAPSCTIEFTSYVINVIAFSLLFYSQFWLNLFLIYNETIKGFRGFFVTQ